MLPDRLRSLTHLLARLPGVGEKTAQRFALYFVGEGSELADTLGTALTSLAQHIRPCSECGNMSEVAPDGSSICSICADPRREPHLLCVVARVSDLLAVESSGAMRGKYFVLGRLLSPLDGIGPEQLPMANLLRAIRDRDVRELIIATPPSVDGEATALFLAQELTKLGVAVTRIASGVPHGGDLEFADRITLGRAIAGRRGMDIP